MLLKFCFPSIWILIVGIFSCGETFVSRSITRGLSNIAMGLESLLHMGSIDNLRDWGYAKGYVRMQWMMLQQGEPEDFVVVTGVQY